MDGRRQGGGAWGKRTRNVVKVEWKEMRDEGETVGDRRLITVCTNGVGSRRGRQHSSVSRAIHSSRWQSEPRWRLGREERRAGRGRERSGAPQEKQEDREPQEGRGSDSRARKEAGME